MPATPWASDAQVRAVLALLPPASFLPQYVLWCAARTDAPLIYHVGGGLALLATVIAEDWTVPDVAGEDVTGNLYVLLVGRPGADRKTTAVKRVAEILTAGVPDRYGPDPGSLQGLERSIALQRQQLIVYEEMGEFFAKTKKSGGNNSVADLRVGLVKAYDGSRVSKILASGISVEATKPFLSVLGGVNPALLSASTDSTDWEGGLLSRFFICLAQRERLMLRRIADPEQLHVQSKWLADWLSTARSNVDLGLGACLGLTPEAMLLWEGLTLATDAAQLVQTDRLCGSAARTPWIALRIGLLLGLSAGCGVNQQPWRIDESMLRVAMTLATISFGNTLVLSQTVTEGPDMRARAQVLGQIGVGWTPLSAVIRGALVAKRRALEMLDHLLTETTIETRTTFGAEAEYRLAGGSTLADASVRAGLDAIQLTVRRHREVMLIARHHPAAYQELTQGRTTMAQLVQRGVLASCRMRALTNGGGGVGDNGGGGILLLNDGLAPHRAEERADHAAVGGDLGPWSDDDD